MHFFCFLRDVPYHTSAAGLWKYSKQEMMVNADRKGKRSSQLMRVCYVWFLSLNSQHTRSRHTHTTPDSQTASAGSNRNHLSNLKGEFYEHCHDRYLPIRHPLSAQIKSTGVRRGWWGRSRGGPLYLFDVCAALISVLRLVHLCCCGISGSALFQPRAPHRWLPSSCCEIGFLRFGDVYAGSKLGSLLIGPQHQTQRSLYCLLLTRACLWTWFTTVFGLLLV